MRFLAVVLLFTLSACQRGGEREKVGEEATGYTGEARLNPYLAAELYLKEKGWSAKSSRTWSNYDLETSVIFMPASFLRSQGMGIRALNWVEEGGTLILSVEGGERERNDFRTSFSGEGVPLEGDFTGMDYLFGELGIEVKEWNWSAFEEGEEEGEGHLSRSWHLTKIDEGFGVGSYHLEQEGEVALSFEVGHSWDFQEDGASRVVGVGYGAGEVMVMAHARPFRSPYLARADHAKFLEMIAEYYGTGDLIFLYGSGTSFFGLLWKEGWMVLVAGGLLLVFWLWKRIPRFGPILQDSFKKPEPYGESLLASARFLWRKGQVEHYLRPLRSRIQREHEGDPETLYERVAEASNLSREEVAEALSIQDNKDPGHVLKVVKKIQALLKR